MRLSSAQRKLLERASFRGWVRASDANDRKTAAVLEREGYVTRDEGSEHVQITDQGREALRSAG